MRILWLKTELLHPVDKGGKIRTYQMLKELKREHEITYLTLDEGNCEPEQKTKALEYCHELICIPHRSSEKFTTGFYLDLATNLVSSLPYAIKKYESRAMRQAIEEIAPQFDLIVCDFLAPAINMPRMLQRPTLLFQHNVEAMIWQRHYDIQRNPLKKLYLRWQWQKMLAFERKMCRSFGSIVAVSRDDAETMQREYQAQNVYDVPTGVDVEYFKPTGGLTTEPNTLVFTGSMDWLPNQDAIEFFIEQILPLIRKRVPQVKLLVVGRNPYPALLEQARVDDSIVVTGRVDDVRPYIEKSAVFIVPLRIGGGTRLKIFEAMAMEKIVISTTIGAEGLPLADGTEILLADEPAAFADKVVQALSDVELNQRVRQQGAHSVREKFGWSRVGAKFTQICDASVLQWRTAERQNLHEHVFGDPEKLSAR